MRPTRTCAVSLASTFSRSAMVARTPATRRSASSRPRMRAAGACCSSLGCMLALLHLEDLAVDLVGDADAAALGDAAGVFLSQHGAVDAAACAIIAERPFGLVRREQPLEGLLEEHGLEVLRGLARLELARRLQGIGEASGAAGGELAGGAVR